MIDENFFKKIASIEKIYPLTSVMDANGILIYASDNHRDYLGYNTTDIVGTTLAPYVNQIDVDYLTNMYRKMLFTQKPIETKSELKHKEGHFVIIRSYCIPLFENGVYKGCTMYSLERSRQDIDIDIFRKDRIFSEIKHAI